MRERKATHNDLHHCLQRAIVAALSVVFFAVVSLSSAPSSRAQDAPSQSELGHSGGRITVALRTDPKTLNPILAVDTTSREVIGTMQADLVHINRQTQRTEPALASSWKVSPDGRKYTLTLRRDVKFSDGVPFTADDVVFTFQLYLDEALGSPQRDLLIIDNKPIIVKKIDAYTVEFDLTKPYGPGERIFDSGVVQASSESISALASRRRSPSLLMKTSCNRATSAGGGSSATK